MRHLLLTAVAALTTSLVTGLFEAGAPLRHRLISALNKLRQRNPRMDLDVDLIELLLAAEIAGHYRSYQVIGPLKDRLKDDDPVLQAMHHAMDQELDRIFRLSLGELADFSGAKYDGDFTLSLEEAQRVGDGVRLPGEHQRHRLAHDQPGRHRGGDPAELDVGHGPAAIVWCELARRSGVRASSVERGAYGHGAGNQGDW